MSEETALLERNTAGLTVRVHRMPQGDFVLECEAGGYGCATPITGATVRDAFDHPALYLSDDQLAGLFPRTTSDD